MKLLTKAVFASLVLAGSLFCQSSTLAQVSSNSNLKTEDRCLAGYPDGTFKGDRPVTRYEFAHSLNACLEMLNQLLRVNQENLATKADFEALIIRQQQLNQELRQLNQPLGTSSHTRSKAEYPLK